MTPAVSKSRTHTFAIIGSNKIRQLGISEIQAGSVQSLKNAPASFQVLDGQLVLSPPQQQVRSWNVLEDQDDFAWSIERIDDLRRIVSDAAVGQLPIERQLASQQGATITAVKLYQAPMVSDL